MRFITKTRSTKALPAVLMALAFAVSAAPARAQLSGTARILVQDGRVSVDRGGGELLAVSMGQSINAGQVVVTGPDGYAQMELSDRSLIEVFPNSRIVFQPSRANWRDLVDVFLGKIRLQIQHLTDGQSPYRVNSPTAVISIRGTVLDVEVDPGTDTTVQVETGLVGVKHRLLPGKEVLVGTGQSLRVSPNVPLAALKGISPLVVAGRIARVEIGRASCRERV